MPNPARESHGTGMDSLRKALEALPRQWCAALWLRHGFGVPEGRLAKAWGVSPGEISKWLRQARRRLERETTAPSARRETHAR